MPPGTGLGGQRDARQPEAGREEKKAACRLPFLLAGTRVAAPGRAQRVLGDARIQPWAAAFFVPAVRAKRARNFSTRPVSTMRVWAPV